MLIKVGIKRGDNGNYRLTIGDKKNWLMILNVILKGDETTCFLASLCFYSLLTLGSLFLLLIKCNLFF